jgi:hypothetical protein
MARFKKGEPPPGYFYPDGGMAFYLDQNKDEWDKFDWLHEDCQLRDKIYKWDFDNGYIMGVYPQAHNNLDGQIDILFKNDHSVKPKLLGPIASNCSPGSLFNTPE